MKYYKILIVIIYFGSCQSIGTKKPEVKNIIKENQKIIEYLENKKYPNEIKREIIENSEINLFENKNQTIIKQLQKNNEIIKSLYQEIEQKDQTIQKLTNKNEQLEKNKYSFIDKLKLFFIGFITGMIFLFLSKLLLNVLKFYYGIRF